MALRRENNQSFADSQADIRDELIRYSKLNGYVAEHFADAKCNCGSTQFKLVMDENAGVAVRLCQSCGDEHGMGDSDDYADEAELNISECTCGGDLFEITVGVSFYADSEDVRWLYVGCRCPVCSLTGCYGDWKNEFNGYQQLLANV
jgi:hypothetical protein